MRITTDAGESEASSAGSTEEMVSEAIHVPANVNASGESRQPRCMHDFGQQCMRGGERAQESHEAQQHEGSGNAVRSEFGARPEQVSSFGWRRQPPLGPASQFRSTGSHR